MLIEFLKQYGDQCPGDIYDHQHGGVADMLIRRGIAKLVPVEVPEVFTQTVLAAEDQTLALPLDDSLAKESLVEVPTIPPPKSNKRGK